MIYHALYQTGVKTRLLTTGGGTPSEALMKGAMKASGGGNGIYVIATDSAGNVSHFATIGAPSVPYQVALGNARRRDVAGMRRWRSNVIAVGING